MTWKKTLCLGWFLGTISTMTALGKERSPFELMPRGEEIALAKSAGLAPWNETATIYVLERKGYVKAVDGTSGFTCMVGRDQPGTRWPICFDAVGTEAILPRYIREAELRLEGKTEEEVHGDTARRFLTGAYRAPSRTGIAYMLSENSITSDGASLLVAPPHLMIYAPNVKAKDIGAVTGKAESPMVLFPGDPHAYIIVFVRDSPVELRRLESNEN